MNWMLVSIVFLSLTAFAQTGEIVLYDNGQMQEVLYDNGQVQDQHLRTSPVVASPGSATDTFSLSSPARIRNLHATILGAYEATPERASYIIRNSQWEIVGAGTTHLNCNVDGDYVYRIFGCDFLGVDLGLPAGMYALEILDVRGDVVFGYRWGISGGPSSAWVTGEPGDQPSNAFRVEGLWQ